MDFLSSRITRTKVHRNDVHFSAIEITSKKTCRNNVDFLIIKITLEKVHGKHLDFLAIAITSKSTWKRRGNSSKFGLQRIKVILTTNARVLKVVRPLGLSF